MHAGISSRKGESSARCSARNSQKAELSYRRFDSSLCTGATFIPSEIPVVPGTTVTWVNKETMPHTVVDTDKGFRSKTLAKDASFAFTFATAGEYGYLCSIHPNMNGKIIVKPAS